MNQGPLHGALIRQWKEDKLLWIEHNLTAYDGHRVHIEFSPGESELAVLKIVEADKAPPIPDAANGLVLDMLNGSMSNSPESLAEGYQRLFLDVAERLGKDEIGSSERA